MPIKTPISPLKKTKKSSCFQLYLSRATALIFTLLLISCGTVYDETSPIEKGEWSDEQALSFEFDIQDTSKLYDIFLEVNHDVDYSYQNIYCIVETFELGTLIRKDQCSLELANSKGKWLGNCGKEACDRKIPFIINTQFNTLGLHKVVIRQNTRNTILKEVNSLRLLVTEAT